MYCLDFTNTAAEDLLDNNWFDACANTAGTRVTVQLFSSSGTLVYSATGTKVGTWTTDQLTSTAGINNQFFSGNHDRAITLSNGDILMISGKSASNNGYGGSLGNGYGIMIYPNPANYYNNLKIMVYPYRQYVAPSVGVRLFTGWTTSNEISWNGGTPMNTSIGETAFLGRFTVGVN